MNISEQFPSKFLKAADIGEGKEATVTIKDCIVEEVGEDKRPVLYFVGKEKGVVLNKTNATNIQDAYGYETDDWFGKKVTLYTAWVDYQGRSMLGLRVRPAREGGAAQPHKVTTPPAFESGDPGFDDSDIPPRPGAEHDH